MVASSLRKVGYCSDFVTPMDGMIVIMDGSLLSIILLLQWILDLSLWNVVCFLGFLTPMDGSLVNMEGSSMLRFCYSNRW